MLCLVYGKLILKYGLLQSVAIYNIAYHFFSLAYEQYGVLYMLILMEANFRCCVYLQA